MNISAWAIRRPVPVVLLFVVLTALGLTSYGALPVTYFPTINVPKVRVTITEPAAAPDQVENEITKIVEDSLATISNLEQIKSIISEGRSVTDIELQIGVPVDRAVSDVRDAVAKVRDELPAAIDELIIEKVDAENQPVVIYSVTDASMSAEALSYFVENVVVRELQGVRGVGRVELVGTVEREIQVQLNRMHLAGLNLSGTAVSDQIADSQFDLPAGRNTIDGSDKSLSVKSTAETLEALGAIRLALPKGGTVAVSDVAAVRDTIKTREDYARLDGKPAVGFTVYKALDAGDVAVADAVQTALEEIATANPSVEFRVVDDSVTLTTANFLSARSTLFEGALLAVFVVFAFLRDWRATLIAAVSLPLSIIPTFWVMDLLGFSLNMLSLLAITLVTGILVDDSIVEIENIVRHRNLGKSAFTAALDASDEIGLAVVAISAAIIAVFAPVGLMGGEIGQYFRQFGLTVAIAVFFSLLVARLITPLIAAHFLISKPKLEKEGAAVLAYKRCLHLAIRWRWLTALLAFALFAVTLFLAADRPSEFLPAQDTGRITVSVELPPGSTLEESEIAADMIARKFDALPEVETVFVRAGAGSDGVQDIRKAMVTVSVGQPDQRTTSLADLERQMAQLLRTVPDLRFEFINDRGGRAVSFAVLSTNGEDASTSAFSILNEMRSNVMFINPTSSEGTPQPAINITLMPARIAVAGITASQVAQSVRVATIGDRAASLPNFNDRGRLVPIRTLIGNDDLDGSEKFRQIRLATPSGAFIPLEAVARLDEAMSVAHIQRMDRRRRIEIGADLAAGISQGQGLDAIQQLQSVKDLPVGVTLQTTGDSDNKDDVFTSFAFAMVAGLSLVMIVLILLFGSALTPLTIITPLPLAVGGVVLALVLTGYAVSLPVVIGILMLMGIVVKNSIMLVDFAIELERSGLPRIEATIEACSERLRPIIMTTLAMVAGMVPATLGHQVGGEFRAPMAVAVIGGLLVSTVLSLLVVPAIHVMVSGLGDAVTKLMSRDAHSAAY